MEKFELLGKDLVYHGTIIDFYKLKLRTPAGHEVSWDHIEHKGASAVLPIDDEGKVLTVTQYRGAIDDIMIEIPAGGGRFCGVCGKRAGGRDRIPRRKFGTFGGCSYSRCVYE